MNLGGSIGGAIGGHAGATLGSFSLIPFGHSLGGEAGGGLGNLLKQHNFFKQKLKTMF
jgi:hypothetical protein